MLQYLLTLWPWFWITHWMLYFSFSGHFLVLVLEVTLIIYNWSSSVGYQKGELMLWGKISTSFIIRAMSWKEFYTVTESLRFGLNTEELCRVTWSGYLCFEGQGLRDQKISRQEFSSAGGRTEVESWHWLGAYRRKCLTWRGRWGIAWRTVFPNQGNVDFILQTELLVFEELHENFVSSIELTELLRYSSVFSLA